MMLQFTLRDLHRVRALVERTARLVGLGADRTGDLVAAVNEIAANAVMHAGGSGSVKIEQSDQGILVEVTDTGPGLPPDLVDERPDVRHEGGRGLWMARRLCRQLTIRTGPTGSTVRLFMPIGPMTA